MYIKNFKQNVVISYVRITRKTYQQSDAERTICQASDYYWVDEKAFFMSEKSKEEKKERGKIDKKWREMRKRRRKVERKERKEEGGEWEYCRGGK